MVQGGMGELEFWNLSGVSDERLLRDLRGFVASGARMDASVVAHLAEVEERRLHLKAAASSLFDYCLRRLGFSESEAFHRITAARLARRFPVIFEMLGARSIHLSGLRVLRDHLTAENHRELLAAAGGKSKKEVEILVATLAPRPDVASRLRKLPARRVARASPVDELASMPEADHSRSVAAASLPQMRGELASGVMQSRDYNTAQGPDQRTNQSTGQCTNQSTGQRTDQSTGQCTDQSTGQYTNQSTGQCTAQSTGQCTAQSTGQCTEHRTAGQCTDQRTAGSADEREERCTEQSEGLGARELCASNAQAVSLLDRGSLSSRAGRGEADELARRRSSRMRALEPLSGTRYLLRVCVGSEFKAKLGRARDLMSHGNPSGELAVVLERALDLLVERLEKQRFAKIERPPAPRKLSENLRGPSNRGEQERKREMASIEQRGLTRRHVPNEVRRAVAERDGERCTYVDEEGRRCPSRVFLQLHHEVAHALGGASTVANLRVLCGSHNRWLAERDFGRAHQERCVSRKSLRRNHAQHRAAVRRPCCKEFQTQSGSFAGRALRRPE
ncbi:MAG TPA: hypothetical protein VG937_36800 [Polyangiaceae bacterium]|nr:hypothetical protein [Polyangiaceae bacterium]